MEGRNSHHNAEGSSEKTGQKMRLEDMYKHTFATLPFFCFFFETRDLQYALEQTADTVLAAELRCLGYKTAVFDI